MSNTEEKNEHKKQRSLLIRDILTCNRISLSVLFLSFCILLFNKHWAAWQLLPIAAILGLIHYSVFARKFIQWAILVAFCLIYILLSLLTADLLVVYIPINTILFLAVFFIETQRRKYSLPPYAIVKKIMLITALVIFAFIQTLNIYGSRVLQQTYNNVKKAKCPTTIEELKELGEFTKIQEQNNGGPLLIAASKIMSTRIKKWREQNYLRNLNNDLLSKSYNNYNTKKITTKELAGLKQLVKENEDILAIIDKALTFPQLRALIKFPKHETRIFETQLPHFRPLMDLCKYLKLHCYYFTQQKNYKESLHTIKRILKLSAMLEKEPFLISYLVRIAIIKQALSASTYLVNNSNLLDNDLLKELQAITVQACSRKYYNARQAFSSELIFGCGLAQTTKGEYFYDWLTFRQRQTYIFNNFPLFSIIPQGWLKLDIANLMNKQLQYVNIAGSDEKKLCDWIKKDKKYKVSLWSPMASLLVPALNSVLRKELACIARARCLWTVLTLKIRQTQKSSLPQNLDFISHNQGYLIIDPFTGKTLQYKQLSGGYKVYSLGNAKPHSKPQNQQQIGIYIKK